MFAVNNAVDHLVDLKKLLDLLANVIFHIVEDEGQRNDVEYAGELLGFVVLFQVQK